MHCFTGGPAEAARSLAMGFTISFSGIVTYAEAPEVQEAARITPLGRILPRNRLPRTSLPCPTAANGTSGLSSSKRRKEIDRVAEFDSCRRGRRHHGRFSAVVPRKAGGRIHWLIRWE
jgi:hypothetical protein